MRRLSRYWWMGLLVSLAFVFVAASDCEESATNQQQPVGMGEVFHATSDGWDIVVTSAAADSSGGEAAYITMEVRATNTGKSAHALGPNRFKLHDSLGRTWKDQTYEAAGGLIELTLQDVQPGLSTEISLGFLVPADVSGLWLETIGGGHIVLGDLGSLLAPNTGVGISPSGSTSFGDTTYESQYPGSEQEGALVNVDVGTSEGDGYSPGDTYSPPPAQEVDSPPETPTPTPTPTPSPQPTPCPATSSLLTWVPFEGGYPKEGGCAIALSYTTRPDEWCRVWYFLPVGLPYGAVYWKETDVSGPFTPDDPDQEYLLRVHMVDVDWCPPR